jgi:hypothetical protein
LKEKRSFTRIIKYEGGSLAECTYKIGASVIHGTKGLKNKRIEISEYFSSFLLDAASAAEPAQADVTFRYEAATISVTVTSQVAQRPSFLGV